MPLLFRTALVNDLGAQYEVERDDPSTNGKLLAQASKQAARQSAPSRPSKNLHKSGWRRLLAILCQFSRPP